MPDWIMGIEGLAVRSYCQHRNGDRSEYCFCSRADHHTSQSLAAVSSEHNQINRVLTNDLIDSFFYIALLKQTRERNSFSLHRFLQESHLKVMGLADLLDQSR